jgi:hypothetical protein
MAVYRTQLRGPDDLKNVKNIQSQYTIRSMSDYEGQAKPKPATTIEFPQPKSDSEPGLSFFSTLNFLLEFCPPHSSEKKLMARLARIGVRAGAPFDAAGMNPEIQEALKRGIEEGEAAITSAASTIKAAEVIGTRKYLSNDYLKRAVAAKLGRFALSKEEALYPLYLTDAKGKPLDATDANYVLNLGPGDLPPVNAFWSITMYDGQSQLLVANPISRFRVSSSMLPTLKHDADGGLTLYVQHESPGEEQVANWLPAPKGRFYMVMRLYGPKTEAYDGTWTPPLVWRADTELKPSIPKPIGAEAAEEVKEVKDMGVAQINVNTASHYGFDLTRLFEHDMEYAIDCHFNILKDKINMCSAIGEDAWSCYHSTTPRHRLKYVVAVSRYL